MKALASVQALESNRFRSFMGWLNAFAGANDLRTHTDWSKVWEYPWVWQYLCDLPPAGLTILDIGSELSPMPWFLSSLGAQVHIIEKDSSFEETWEKLREKGFPVTWQFVEEVYLPFGDNFFDVVLSFSVLEHVTDKQAATDEIVRVLKPGGRLCLTFDICEVGEGMTYPSWGGEPFDMASFDACVWRHPQLEPLVPGAAWNREDMAEFVKWNLRSAPYHNYTVGGAVLSKRQPQIDCRTDATRTHVLDAGLQFRDAGDLLTCLGVSNALGEDARPVFEARSLGPLTVPEIGKRLWWEDEQAINVSLDSCRTALLLSDPLLGGDWPEDCGRGNARKLDWCHRRGIMVHAAGIEVAHVLTGESLGAFQRSYLPIASWTVRSERCRENLANMGVPRAKVACGADWAWLVPWAADRGFINEWRSRYPSAEGRRRAAVALGHDSGCQSAKHLNLWADAFVGLAAELALDLFVFDVSVTLGLPSTSTLAHDLVETVGRRTTAVFLSEVLSPPSLLLSVLAAMDFVITNCPAVVVLAAQSEVPCLPFGLGRRMTLLEHELGLSSIGDQRQPDQERMTQEARRVLVDPGSFSRPALVGSRALKLRASNNLSLWRYSLHANRS